MQVRRHVGGLDGLRAISALLVILFHLEISGFALGWAGVQFFFVISGFLITRILIASRAASGGDAGRFFRVFYAKRSLRIFPLYYLYLAIAVVVAVALHKPLGQWWQFLLYIQNYTLGVNGFRTELLMGHTWSLAVEEQFYLLWPMLVWLTAPRSLFKISIALIVTSVAFRWGILSYTGNPYLHFATLPSNVDTLALGTLLAVSYDDERVARLRLPILGASAALLSFTVLHIGYSKLWLPTAWTFAPLGPFLFTILGVFFFAVLLVVLHLPAGAIAWLDCRPLAFVGKVSYGVYIYHGLVIVIVRRALRPLLQDPDAFPGIVLLGTASIATTIFVSWLSYRFFESRFLELKERLASADAAPAAGGAAPGAHRAA